MKYMKFDIHKKEWKDKYENDDGKKIVGSTLKLGTFSDVIVNVNDL